MMLSFSALGPVTDNTVSFSALRHVRDDAVSFSALCPVTDNIVSFCAGVLGQTDNIASFRPFKQMCL